MQYEELITALFRPENEAHLPDGCAYSYAICQMQGDRLLDCFFLYTIDYANLMGYGPVAKLSLDMSTGIVDAVEEMDQAESFPLVFDSGSGERLEAARRYRQLYPKLREIVGKKERNAGEVLVAAEAFETLLTFTNQEQRSAYQKIAPETYALMKRCYETNLSSRKDS